MTGRPSASRPRGTGGASLVRGRLPVATLAATLAVPTLLTVLPRTAHPQAGTGAPLPSRDEAERALDRLRGLEGSWEGPSMDVETGEVYLDRARFEYHLTGAGSAVTELSNVGTPDELLSVFFMDGERLVLHHYCSAGDQPSLELTRATGEELVFTFSGGANVDPRVDGHIHEIRFILSGDGPVESFWSWYEAGEEHHVNRRVLRERRAGDGRP